MNTRLFARIGAVALSVMVLFSCQKQEDETIPVLKIDKAVVGADGGTVKLEVASTSAWTLSLDPATASSWLHLSQSSGEKGIYNVSATVDANAGDPRTVKIVLSGPTLKAQQQLNQLGVTGTPDAPLWLELPKLDHPEYIFGTHDMTGGSYVSNPTSGTRNYSFYWSTEDHLSLWVAYPLNNSLMGSGSYGYDWSQAYDPMVPPESQKDLTEHSYGGWDWADENWNRGHLMPRRDRQTSQVAVTSTCRTTNVAPQSGTFNAGIWGDLEARVRTYANSSDTLYVVVGCDWEGTTTYTSSYYPPQVPVPVAFYKALLRKKGSDFSMMAFYLPHTQDAYNDGVFGGNFMNYQISVDELEKKVGLSFFDNLVDNPYFPGHTKESVATMKKNIAKW
jgi:DNA/RNA endonuclease G (NUC1)